MGANEKLKSIHFAGTSKKLPLQIWDIPGADKFRTLSSIYFRDADAVIICYDIGDTRSFDSVSYWADQMEKNCNRGSGNYVIAMAGNKCDIDDSKKQVTMKKASELAKEHKMIFHETSAKTGEGVNDMFMELIRKLIICIRKREEE